LSCLGCGRVTMTTESYKNGATTLSRMNFSGYVGHVTVFSWMLTIECCLVVGSGLGLGFDFLFIYWLCTRIFTTFRCDCRAAFDCGDSGTTCCVSAGLESIGIADVRLLVKLMCLLAVGRIPNSCLGANSAPRVIPPSVSLVPDSSSLSAYLSFVATRTAWYRLSKFLATKWTLD